MYYDEDEDEDSIDSELSYDRAESITGERYSTEDLTARTNPMAVLVVSLGVGGFS